MRKSEDIMADMQAKAIEVNAAADNREAFEKADAEFKELEREMAIKDECDRTLVSCSVMSNNEKKELSQFSIASFLKEVAEDRLTGFNEEMNKEGEQELKDCKAPSNMGYHIPSKVLRAINLKTIDAVNSSTDTEGGNMVIKGTMRYVDALRERLALTGLGATYLSGLNGEIPFVTDSMTTANWLGEGVVVTEQTPSFTLRNMKPKCIGVHTAYTLDMLNQTSIDVEAKLWQNILDAHAAGLEKAAINGSGLNNEPLGILNTSGIGSVVIGTNGGALTYAKGVELEGVVNSSNANMGNMGYLTNGKVQNDMKTTPRLASTDSRMILDDLNPNMFNGYKFAWTNQVPSNLIKGSSSTCSAMLFGNWSDLLIGQWGGLDIVKDNVTGAGARIVKLYVFSFNDIFVQRAESFAAIKDITTTL